MTSRNARFQQWQALLTNRPKRQRASEFLVQGVRPIGLAVAHRWVIRAVLYDMRRPLSRWAADLLDRLDTNRVAMAPELLRELGGKTTDTPELVAVVKLPADDLSRVPVTPGFLGVVFDRPTSPGNIGTLVRSVDAFGGGGVIVTGHAADPYDPKAVRASTGSLFCSLSPWCAWPPDTVLDWVRVVRAGGLPPAVVGADETGPVDVMECDLTRPSLILIGNESAGLSARWRAACDELVHIPMTGSANSPNAATAATLVLYEAARQRTAAVQRPRVQRVTPSDRAGEHARLPPLGRLHDSLPNYAKSSATLAGMPRAEMRCGRTGCSRRSARPS